jgi:hypothetical protein
LFSEEQKHTARFCDVLMLKSVDDCVEVLMTGVLMTVVCVLIDVLVCRCVAVGVLMLMIVLM